MARPTGSTKASIIKKKKQIARLYFINGLSQDQIAKKIGDTRQNVSHHLSVLISTYEKTYIDELNAAIREETNKIDKEIDDLKFSKAEYENLLGNLPLEEKVVSDEDIEYDEDNKPIHKHKETYKYPTKADITRIINSIQATINNTRDSKIKLLTGLKRIQETQGGGSELREEEERTKSIIQKIMADITKTPEPSTKILEGSTKKVS